MTILAWPSSVPTSALLGDSSYSESGEDYVAETKVQVGPPSRRRRASVPSTLLTFQTKMSFDEYDYLVEFYLFSCLNGTLPFTRPHPRKFTETITAMFEAYPESGSPVDHQTFFVTLKLRSTSRTTVPPNSFDFSDINNSGYEMLL